MIHNFKQTTLIAFVKEHVSPGSTVHTDGLKGFEDLQAAGVKHRRRTQPLRSALRRGATSVVPLAAPRFSIVNRPASATIWQCIRETVGSRSFVVVVSPRPITSF